MSCSTPVEGARLGVSPLPFAFFALMHIVKKKMCCRKCHFRRGRALHVLPRLHGERRLISICLTCAHNPHFLSHWSFEGACPKRAMFSFRRRCPTFGWGIFVRLVYAKTSDMGSEHRRRRKLFFCGMPGIVPSSSPAAICTSPRDVVPRASIFALSFPGTFSEISPRAALASLPNTQQDACWNLLVMLTTANFPDVIIPAFTQNRAAGLLFFPVVVFGVFVLMNVSRAGGGGVTRLGEGGLGSLLFPSFSLAVGWFLAHAETKHVSVLFPPLVPLFSFHSFHHYFSCHSFIVVSCRVTSSCSPRPTTSTPTGTRSCWTRCSTSETRTAPRRSTCSWNRELWKSVVGPVLVAVLQTHLPPR